jgi:spore germination protein YaaH
MFRKRRRPRAGPADSTASGRPAGRLALAVVAAGAAIAIVGASLAGHGPAGSGDSDWAGGRPGAASASGPTEGGPAASGNPDGSPGAVPAPGHEVYGFVPYWEMDGTIVEHLARTRATTVALFSVTHTATGGLAMTQTGARRITGPIGRAIIADVHAHHRRVDLAYTSFAPRRNRVLLGSTDLQDRVIANLVQLTGQLGVDGIAVDLEQVNNADIPAYGAFVGRLRAALRADRPDATVTVATGAGPQGAALALAASMAGADRVFLMGYDYRTRSSDAGAVTPLARRDGDERTLGWSLDLYAAAGVPVERTLLGLPLYGMVWPTASPEPGAPATGRGSVWIPRRNLATLHDRTLKPTYDGLETVAFLAVPRGDAWQAVYYDTPESLTPKLALGEARGLAGAGFWALGYDRGLPGYADLIDRFRTGGIPAATGPVTP